MRRARRPARRRAVAIAHDRGVPANNTPTSNYHPGNSTTLTHSPWSLHFGQPLSETNPQVRLSSVQSACTTAHSSRIRSGPELLPMAKYQCSSSNVRLVLEHLR